MDLLHLEKDRSLLRRPVRAASTCSLGSEGARFVVVAERKAAAEAK
jgi:hypothetical protein